MKKLGLLLFVFLASCAFGQSVVRNCAGQPCLPIVSSGGTLVIDNYVGAMNVTFEELITGSPASSSITIQGCMRGGTCDSAMDTNSSNAAASIRSVVPTSKPYSYFLITATFSGGTNTSVQVNPVLTVARAGGGGGGLVGMTAGQVPIAATSSTVNSSKAIQGTDTNLLSSGVISGTGALLCTDANSGATTLSCPVGAYNANTTGQGNWLAPFGTIGLQQNASTATVSAGTVRCGLVPLPYAITITKATVWVTTTSSGNHEYIGLYNSAKNLILQANFTLGASSGVALGAASLSPSSINLSPASYYICFSADNATSVLQAATAPNANSITMLNTNTVTWGLAANTFSAGNMPSSLGAISTNAAVIPLVLFEP